MQWFESWFDSPYYPVLYDHRDESEAAIFIKNIFEFLQVKKGAHCLDLACGRGRHAQSMHQLGMKVFGIDLSPSSIQDAKDKYQTNGLTFQTADMRHFNVNSDFDVVLNLFTSFGYFEDRSDNLLTLQQIQKHLIKNGYLVLDYFNANHPDVTDTALKIIHKGDLVFKTQKRVTEEHVVKKIEVTDHEEQYVFQEKVQLLSLSWFQSAFESLNMNIEAVFGDYELNKFDENDSKRMILIVKNSAKDE